jgi:hypothetical protein
MTNRAIAPWLHIAAAAALGTYVYSPRAAEPVFARLCAWACFPRWP